MKISKMIIFPTIIYLTINFSLNAMHQSPYGEDVERSFEGGSIVSTRITHESKQSNIPETLIADVMRLGIRPNDLECMDRKHIPTFLNTAIRVTEENQNSFDNVVGWVTENLNLTIDPAYEDMKRTP